jgi:hypothetical protein
MIKRSVLTLILDDDVACSYLLSCYTRAMHGPFVLCKPYLSTNL